jgi:uncharacterized delta-60 repeat protein
MLPQVHWTARLVRMGQSSSTSQRAISSQLRLPFSRIKRLSRSGVLPIPPPFYDISDCYSDIEVARFNPNGRKDTSFGNGNGFVTTDINGMSDSAGAIAIQSDGKIVVGGLTEVPSDPFQGLNTRPALVRYNPDGTLDTGFGNGGKVTTALSVTRAEIYDIALQSDGKIVAVGQFYQGGQTTFLVIRYNADGTLDSSFGNVGIVMTDFFLTVKSRTPSCFSLMVKLWPEVGPARGTGLSSLWRATILTAAWIQASALPGK